MDELTTFKREMAGLKKDFAKFRRQFQKLHAEFKEHAKDVQANWEKADRLMFVHMRDMEVFHDSHERRLARQQGPPLGSLESMNAENLVSRSGLNSGKFRD